MADQPSDQGEQIGRELRQFFNDLTKGNNLDDYHAKPKDYVDKQQKDRVVGADAAGLILEKKGDKIREYMLLPLRIVFPPAAGG